VQNNNIFFIITVKFDVEVRDKKHFLPCMVKISTTHDDLKK
jgi:hypothetical protein